ncbi:pirin family protein [Thaumasiovibrio subtropicus]|uniref:pirin family protein n=1 Tax=Thaumasiovibrio subtropicus TaxID=1891207 RepID=UPI000B3518EA|nr:pirin family protein [Thaumasiovibrio subtropicus]
MVTRKVEHIQTAHPSSDGDGVKIRRVHGFNNAKFSPYLMIDELKSENPDDYIGGFPPHPHRGIETLTYMLKGHFQHKDHMGNVGELRSGGAQWMSAGKGVIHSEMPIMDQGELHGFQIWINLPADEKKKPAQYHDFQPDVIVEKQLSDISTLRVISGDLTIEGDTLSGPLQQTGVPTTIADWRAKASTKVNACINPEHQALIFVYQGEISINSTSIKEGQLALLSAGEGLEMKSLGPAGALLLTGIPIDEPVVHYGPFVMNTMEEIEQAIQDYQNGVLTD